MQQQIPDIAVSRVPRLKKRDSSRHRYDHEVCNEILTFSKGLYWWGPEYTSAHTHIWLLLCKMLLWSSAPFLHEPQGTEFIL